MGYALFSQTQQQVHIRRSTRPEYLSPFQRHPFINHQSPDHLYHPKYHNITTKKPRLPRKNPHLSRKMPRLNPGHFFPKNRRLNAKRRPAPTRALHSGIILKLEPRRLQRLHIIHLAAL